MDERRLNHNSATHLSRDFRFCRKTYQANVLSHLWLMQDVKEELKKNKGAELTERRDLDSVADILPCLGSFIITASVAGRIPSGSSIVSSFSARDDCYGVERPVDMLFVLHRLTVSSIILAGHLCVC